MPSSLFLSNLNRGWHGLAQTGHEEQSPDLDAVFVSVAASSPLSFEGEGGRFSGRVRVHLLLPNHQKRLLFLLLFRKTED
jgi:hypothetical protein